MKIPIKFMFAFALLSFVPAIYLLPLLGDTTVKEQEAKRAKKSFKEKARFYSEDFKHEEGMAICSMSVNVGIKDDKIIIGKPRVYINDSMATCYCGREAVEVTVEKGKIVCLCSDHEGEKHPVNQQNYPTLKQEDTSK